MSIPPESKDSWVSRYLPPLVALLACLLLILAPIWAYQWYRQPFLGFFEPNLVLSQIRGSNWPAVEAGATWPDRLTAINDIPVATANGMYSALEGNKTEPLILAFERQDQSTYRVVATPRQVHWTEVFTQFIVPYYVSWVFLISGAWTYRLGGSQRPTRAFLLMTASTAIMTGGFLDMNTTHNMVLFWALSLSVTAGALANLSLVFPKPVGLVERYPSTRYLVWLATLLLAVPAILAILAPGSPWDYMLTWRLAYVYIAVAMFFFLASQLVRIFRSPSQTRRQQSRIIIFGAALAFGPSLLFYFVPVSFGLSPQFQVALYSPPLIILPVAIGYAIVRYRMLGIDQLLSNALTYTLVTAASIGLYYLLIALFTLVLQASFNPNHPLILALYLFLLVVAFNPLRNLMHNTVDRVFYRTRADYRYLLSNLARDLVVTPDASQTLQVLKRAIKPAIQPMRLILYLYDDDHALYVPTGVHAYAVGPIPQESALVRLVNQRKVATWLPPEKPLPPELTTPESQALLEIMDCQVFAPLGYEGRMIGFIALGERRSGEPYSQDDLDFLNAVANQSSLAVENARLFTNLQRTLDETLEMKNLMDDIFASIASGIITTDLQNKITLFNQAAEQILGIQAVDALGRPLQSALASMWPELEPLATATIDEGAITLSEEINPDMPGRGCLSLRLSCAPLRDARQEAKGATIVIEDLTEQREIEAERERIRQTFGRVVAPRVRDRLLSDPSSLNLDGVRQMITILFADIHQFTPFSERTAPEKLFQVLNSYLSLGAQAVLDEEGTLDKFIGDAVMAIWNAPDRQADHTLRAVRAALAMTRAVRAHRSNIPPEDHLFFSIGITCGEAMVGNVGTKDLFNYTAIGDVVNLAQRLETIAEPGQIMISEEVYTQVAGHVIVRELPRLAVKGRRQEVTPYLLEGLRDEKAP